MCAGATLGTSASATERGGASPSLTVHGRAGSDRRRPKSKLGRDGALGDAVGGGAGTVGAARGRLPSWARSKVGRRAGVAAVSSRWRLRESSASSASAALVVPQTAQDRYASFSFSSVQAVHTHISTSAADQPAGAPTRPGVARTVRLALANASGSAPQTGQRLNDAHLLPIDECVIKAVCQKWHLAACKTLASSAGLEPHRWPIGEAELCERVCNAITARNRCDTTAAVVTGQTGHSCES